MIFPIRMFYSMLVIVLTVFALASQSSAEENTDSKIEEKLAKLLTLKGDEYIEARNRLIVLLEDKETNAGLIRIKERSQNQLIALLVDSLLYRISNRRKASLLDRHWRRPGVGRFDQHGRERVLTYNSDYPQIVIICFGTESFPVIAENLLLSDVIRQRKDLVATIAEMRDRRSCDVLLEVIRNPRYSRLCRLFAIWCIDRYLGGLEEADYGSSGKSELTGVGDSSRMIPPEIKDYARERKLPAFDLEPKKRAIVAGSLENLMENEKDTHMKAMLVWALRHGYSVNNKTTVSILTKTLKSEESAWIRAWCVVALKTIDSENARSALKEHKKIEKNEEVLLVMEGKRQPLEPASGLPAETILPTYDVKLRDRDSGAKAPILKAKTSRGAGIAPGEGAADGENQPHSTE